MELRIHMAVATTILLNVSCVSVYQKATVSRTETKKGKGEDTDQSLVYQYRIYGLQQMMIYVVPEEGFFTMDKQRNIFTQQELSKLRIKVTSLSGKLSVNGFKMEQGNTLVVDLRKEFNYHGRAGVVKDFGKYGSVIRFVSYKNVHPEDNLCDFTLTIEDPEGITRDTGLRVHGGFTDSL
jgi:hypothetical protein